jgi:tyrosyl-tRNA synthetase
MLFVCLTLFLLSMLYLVSINGLRLTQLNANRAGRLTKLAVCPGLTRRNVNRKLSSESINDDTLELQERPQQFQSSFLQTMQDRGFIHQCTNFQQLDSKLSSGIIKGYLGFDATASSLHVGSLMQIMILRHMQKCGHKPVVLVGGGTTKIGDPSGRDESRQILTTEVIQQNADSLSKVFSKFITFGDGPTDAVMLNNAEWLENINYLDFLRDFGKHFTINRMLTYESVKQRLAREQPLTFLEFNYMLLQAYDFLELNTRHHVTLQLGGSDQWGNIVNGVELVRKTKGRHVFGLTAPLISTSDGKKMGKSVAGAVWLNK